MVVLRGNQLSDQLKTFILNYDNCDCNLLNKYQKSAFRLGVENINIDPSFLSLLLEKKCNINLGYETKDSPLFSLNFYTKYYQDLFRMILQQENVDVNAQIYLQPQTAIQVLFKLKSKEPNFYQFCIEILILSISRGLDLNFMFDKTISYQELLEKKFPDKKNEIQKIFEDHIEGRLWNFDRHKFFSNSFQHKINLIILTFNVARKRATYLQIPKPIVFEIIKHFVTLNLPKYFLNK